MESLDSILKGKTEPTNVVERPVQQEEPKPEVRAEEPKADRDRDDHGRFKAKEQEAQTPAKPEAPKAEATPKVETKPAPTAVEKVKPETKPYEAEQTLDPRHKAAIAQANDERRKRQAAEERLRAYEQQQQRQIPNPQENPAEFAGHFQNQLMEVQWTTTLNTSEFAARDKFGDDVVNEAQRWFIEQREANPALEGSLRQQQHPYRWVVQQYKQHQTLSKLGDDPDAYINSEVERRLKERETQLPQVPARPAAPVPPPSLANAQSAAGGVSARTVYEGPTPISSILRR